MGRNSKKRRTRKRSPSVSSSSSSSSSASSSSEKRARVKLRKLERRLQMIENNKAFQVHPRDEDVVPEFDPQKSELSVEAWVSRVDDIAKTR